MANYDESTHDTYLTADMVAQWAYCPRRLFLMYVDGRWDENYYTEHGSIVHARTDGIEDALPDCERDSDAPVCARSVMLTDEHLQLRAKLDLLEAEGDEATPVEYKRGSVPDTPEKSYEPVRIQLMIQALLLRAHGFKCTRAIVYYASSKKRVPIPMDEALERRTLEVIEQTRAILHSEDSHLPPPLEDSPKCPGCSLSGICLPDETRFLQDVSNHAHAPSTETDVIPDIRRLYAARPDAVPLYIQEQGARIGKNGDSIKVTKGETVLGVFPLKDVSQLVLCGNISISAQCLHLLCQANIPVVHLSMGHWFYGITFNFGLKNAYDRAAQFAVASNPLQKLAYAKAFVKAKTLNQRTFLRRNAAKDVDASLKKMKFLIERIENAQAIDELMGIEGSIAAIYFGNWDALISQDAACATFIPESRNRRPPKDPVNALLSFGYAMLAKDITVALMGEGLDPYWGFLHAPRHGKPALALDLMEEFRPLIVDSAVLSAINQKMVTPGDFVLSNAGCAMKDSARKAFIRAYEQRLDQLITHPIFSYRCSWRVVLQLQAKLLAKALRGDICGYIGIVTR